MRLVKNVVTALCTKESQTQLLVVAHCLLVSKSLAQVGALLILRKLNTIIIQYCIQKLVDLSNLLD